MATLKFTPRTYQKPLITDPARFKVWIMHRRFGKTYAAVRKICIDAIRSTGNRPQFAYFSPEGEQGEKIAWPEFMECLKDLPGVHINKLKKIITFEHNNAHIYVLGLKEPDRVRGMYFDGVVLDEFGDIDKAAWQEVIFPTLTDRKGWAVLMGTPKGRDGLYEMFEIAQEHEKESPDLWSAKRYTVLDTDVFQKDEIEVMRMNMSDAQFRQEYMCEFDVDFSNRYYLEHIAMARRDGRIGKFPYQGSMPVYTAWDFGRDGTAVWFAQRDKNGKVYLIDYWEKIDCVSIAEPLQYIHNTPYVYAYHILPHDAVHKSIRGESSIKEIFSNHNLKTHVLERGPVDAGIYTAQNKMIDMYFDEVKCEQGIIALSNYQAKVDKKTGLTTNQPLHDQFSHGSDAFRYLVLGLGRLKNNMFDMHFGISSTPNIDSYEDYDPLD